MIRRKLLNWLSSINLRQPVVLGVLTTFVGNGCMLGPDYLPPPVTVEDSWIYQNSKSLDSLKAVNPYWWQSAFADPILDDLVAQAIENNLELRSAALRALQAQQLLAIAVGNQYPQIQQIEGLVDRSKYVRSGITGNLQTEYYLNFNLTWELDMWGQLRRLVNSAAADFEASMAEYDGLLVSIIAQVAQTYINIRTIKRRLEVARENIRIQQEGLRIAEVKFHAGEVSALDAEQAQTLLSNTEATVPGLEIALQQFKNTLSILLGMPPHSLNDILSVSPTVPHVPSIIAIGMPQDLLRQRPDIRQAERLLAAQGELIGVARAELYPNFSIGGLIGAIDIRGGQLNGRSDAWDLFVDFEWNVFNYGRLRNNVRLQDATFQQLVSDYQQVVLQAQVDVENAIVAYLKSQEQQYFYNIAAMASEEAVNLSLTQYIDGQIQYNTVLTTMVSNFAQQDILVVAQGAVAANLVQVYLSLGGGWQIVDGLTPLELLPEETIEDMLRRTHYWDKLLD
ncbi:efflux transporter outer membrane subunit [Microbulbifer sp. THAF38]|uniref:efflux transporter outer membrane subunit n=1 Tax=Microbulbifer sp. THAF38 TaxID=2587856 RepID=UPI001269341D|nr:efflux transporter outer membrane subunit [Microbulbifer sp. THAF38]QFT54734.1 Toluene efflux pump outer membrane protein TtgF precursor [Microbulbifer sp. THAF38]